VKEVEQVQSYGSKFHELMKDPMLEKLVLLVVSFFSMSTEKRLSTKVVDPQCEAWHAQSVIYACYYLPKTCPLVDHLTASYFKNFKNPEPTVIPCELSLPKQPKQLIAKVD
jgi:hypothetical protein